jgi:hypothetical protein
MDEMTIDHAVGMKGVKSINSAKPIRPSMRGSISSKSRPDGPETSDASRQGFGLVSAVLRRSTTRLGPTK